MSHYINSRDKNSEMFRDFLVESEDIIQGLNKNLYELKSLCDSSRVTNPDIVNALFRGIHTLKGISEITGFPRIASLSHRLEDLLDCLRFGKIQLNHDVVDTLFNVADILTELLKNIRDQGIEHTEITQAIDKIGDILLHKISDEEASESCSSAILPDLSLSLSEFELYRLMETLKDYRTAYRILARLHIDTVDEEVEKLHRHLIGSGEIIAVLPVSGFSSDGMVSFEFIFSAGEEGFKNGLNDSIRGEIISIQTIDLQNTPIDKAKQQSEFDNEELYRHSARSITKTVRVDIERLETLLNTVGEILLLNNSVSSYLTDITTHYGNNITSLNINKTAKQLQKKLAFLRDGLIDIRLVPVEYLFSRLLRIVDMLSRELSKEIRLEVSGGDTKLDKSMIEELADPLMHIIRNAIDHGIEDEDTRNKMGKPSFGTIKVSAVQKDSSVVIDITDDGGGIDYGRIYDTALERGLIGPDEKDETRLLKMLFQPGFSTKNTIDDISGRGVGLDVVAKNIADLSGMVEVETLYEKGTTFRITLPVTLLIVRALIVAESGREFAIPVNSISENLRLYEEKIIMISDRESINLRGHCIPLIRLNDVLKYPQQQRPSAQKNKYVIIAGITEKKIGIIVDKIMGKREILIKPVGKFFNKIQCVAGFAEIDSKKVVPVVDVLALAERTFTQHVSC